jgi:hypothetical protein
MSKIIFIRVGKLEQPFPELIAKNTTLSDMIFVNVIQKNLKLLRKFPMQLLVEKSYLLQLKPHIKKSALY